jgi:hypothetical protein
MITRRCLLKLTPSFWLPWRALAQDETGFQPIFDGKSLTGWDGDPAFWRVEAGAIIGETTTTHQPKQNTFCIWRGAKPADFEWKAQYRITGGNSGFQYRSIERLDVAKWVMQGYQADIDAQQTYTGQLYEERGRGFLAPRGTFSYAGDGKKSEKIGSTGDSDPLKTIIRNADWNDIHIVARGNWLVHLWNGHVMSVFLDDDKGQRKFDGLLGIQLHVTQTGMKIEARDIRLKMF